MVYDGRHETVGAVRQCVVGQPVAQAKLGRAQQALVARGRAYLLDTLGELWRKVEAGRPPTVADRGALWLSATHATQGALEAIGMLYTTAGAAASTRAARWIAVCAMRVPLNSMPALRSRTSSLRADGWSVARPSPASGIDYRGEEE